MKTLISALLLVLAAATTQAQSITLKGSVAVDGSYVRLGDLFRNTGDKTDVIVAYAPAPGKQAVFDANWLYLSPENKKPSAPSLDWAPIESGVELSIWESQWDDRAEGCESIFLPALLTDPSVQFWAGRSEANIRAGFVSNVTGSVVGISNTFGPYEDCVAHAARQFSNYGIVCYEGIETVSEAINLGFEVTGDLTVWTTF